MPPIYFAFPDGVFDYICAECDALCCRGQGLGGSLRREMGTLLTLYPSLQTMTVKRRGDVIQLATFRGTCQFLDADRHCRIERQHGKALKPGICTLFPFNAFSRIGASLVVRPHFICPLRMRVPAAPGAVAGTHEDIRSAIADSLLIDEQTWTHTVEPVRNVERSTAPAILEREARFRDRCGDALGRMPFRSLLAAQSAGQDAFERAVSRAAATLGLPALHGAAGDGVDDVLLAVAPSVRLQLFELGDDAILVALAVGEDLVRHAAVTAARPPTAQAAYTHLTAMAPLLRLLARTRPLDELARVQIPPFVNPGLTRAAQTLLAGLWAGQSGLDAAERAMAELPSPSDRMALLVEIGKECG
jgi:hypothetical protein